MDDLVFNVANIALMVFIKHRDKVGLQYFCQNLAKEVSPEIYRSLFINFFQVRSEELTEEDVEFFENMANEFIAESPKNKKKVKVQNEDEYLKKVKKQIVYFKKTFNWELGKDFSFKKGRIYMSEKNKQKLREAMS